MTTWKLPEPPADDVSVLWVDLGHAAKRFERSQVDPADWRCGFMAYSWGQVLSWGPVTDYDPYGPLAVEAREFGGHIEPWRPAMTGKAGGDVCPCGETRRDHAAPTGDPWAGYFVAGPDA